MRSFVLASCSCEASFNRLLVMLSALMAASSGASGYRTGLEALVWQGHKFV